MRYYGIDIGSVSLKLAVFDEGSLVRTEYLKHHGSPFDLLLEVLRKAVAIEHLAVTGQFPSTLSAMLGAVRVNEVEASVSGVLHFHPGIRSIIEIGGEDSKLISIDGRIKDFSSNTICAAGAGIFLDQQAQRLCYPVEELGTVAMRSKSPARIAGRCSVFAKSDMIHLQQIGTPPEDLVAGLCLSLARTFKNVIARGRDLDAPVAFIGGVAANHGVVNAFRTVLGIKEKQLVIPRQFNTMGAIGAVLYSREHGLSADYKGLIAFERWLQQPKAISRLPALNGRKEWHPSHHARMPRMRTKTFLGIDVGSISTNLVLIDDQGTVLARQYLWTRGRPIEVVLEGLKDLGEHYGQVIDIIGVGTTGSGRYLIGNLVGADIIKNEISAQARAAVECDPDVDTVFEIGGQDSKYISIERRTIVDFEMNKVCAAGTGSFLEEQALVLGVKLEEFGDLALEASSPMNLGERCTVFIGSEVVHHQRDSDEHKNLLAGLGYSVVFNYLNRVVGNKKIGKRILFQGGVAANKAVVSAFEETLHTPVVVPVNHDVTGAIGIALLARDSGISCTRFKGFNLANKPYRSTSFVCHQCSNDCEVNRINMDGERPIFYGGRCERYERKETRARSDHPDLFKLRNDIFFATQQQAGTKIGIPRALIFYELFPFFYKFLSMLGFDPVLSEPTNKRIIEMGTEISATDTCFPVKVAYGHIQALYESGVRQFFIPSVITMPPNSGGFDRSFVCPYVQTLPYLARAVFSETIEIHSPYLYFDRGKEGFSRALHNFGARIGRPRKDIDRAVAEGFKHQAAIHAKILSAGRQAISGLKDLAFVVCSRPYNGYDIGLNLDLPKKVRELGVMPVPVDFIPLDYSALGDDFVNMYWHYGQRLLAAAETISRDERLFPVYVSNFSCGPDSFITRYFKEKIREKPLLMIEIDEHSGDAGLITRLEAFHDSIKGARRMTVPRKMRAVSEIKGTRTIFLPDMCDHARVLAAAMNRAGIRSQVLPPPDEASVMIGRQYTSGRECLPAIITAGDMIKKLRSSDFDRDQAAFFMAQGSGPCRFGQYYRLHRLILDELGFSDIPIYAPNQGPSLFDDLAGPMGLKFLFSAWDGICAVDALEAKVRTIRPYETVKGAADGTYADALRSISRAIEEGECITNIVRHGARQLDSIARHQRDKPRIGIVGEIYVRSQKFSNNNLIKRLEELGCEVMMPSIGEWFFYTNYTRIRNCWWFKQYRRSIFTYFFNRYMRWRQDRFYGIVNVPREHRISSLLELGGEYIHPSFEGEAILSVGKTIEYIKDACSGIVNVMPFTCMPGNIVSSVYRRLKERNKDLPLFILSVDGIDHAVDAMRLETFVSQARDRAHSVTPRS
jgi:predicted CoA-substrate-specific enzyme activase